MVPTRKMMPEIRLLRINITNNGYNRVTMMSEIPHCKVLDSSLRLGYVHGGVVVYRPGESLPERILPDYELVLVIEGDVVYRRDGRPPCNGRCSGCNWPSTRTRAKRRVFPTSPQPLPFRRNTFANFSAVPSA